MFLHHFPFCDERNVETMDANGWRMTIIKEEEKEEEEDVEEEEEEEEEGGGKVDDRLCRVWTRLKYERNRWFRERESESEREKSALVVSIGAGDTKSEAYDGGTCCEIQTPRHRVESSSSALA